MSAQLPVKRAKDRQVIAPLIELCKAGRLFDVQEWIAAGKPINSPPVPKKGRRVKSPLEYSIERGFHSLVQVLLEGGAVQEPEGYYCPMNQALRARRLDIAQLLIAHGFDPKAVDMKDVFESWDPQIITFFIEHGADIQKGHPFAYAFCNRIRTALRPFKECLGRHPDVQEQANIALRHHCKEGNLKWVSLMLWAGADPYQQGTECPEEESDSEDHGISALEFAALYRHFDVFELKAIRSKEDRPEAVQFFRYLTRGDGISILKRLLEKGVIPNDQENGGCSAIQYCLEQMSWRMNYSSLFGRETNDRNRDSTESREYLRAIHLMAKHGGKWNPQSKYEMNSARRSLLSMKPDYTVEFTWIMSKYKACSRACIHNLLGTPTMKALLSAHRARVQELLATLN